jgi:hypothetical protein
LTKSGASVHRSDCNPYAHQAPPPPEALSRWVDADSRPDPPLRGEAHCPKTHEASSHTEPCRRCRALERDLRIRIWDGRWRSSPS